MYLCYYDEVKYNPPVQTSFWPGGIAVCDEHLATVEEQVNILVDQTFGKRTLERGTEFHGHEIFQGKGAFRGIHPSTRLETQWVKGRKITRLLDTVHFAQSHHSRMVQLADVFLYSRQFHRVYYDKQSRQAFNKVIRESGAMSCQFHKVWPYEKRLHASNLSGWLPPSTPARGEIVVELPDW